MIAPKVQHSKTRSKTFFSESKILLCLEALKYPNLKKICENHYPFYSSGCNLINIIKQVLSILKQHLHSKIAF